jgi:hypothetical protein
VTSHTPQQLKLRRQAKQHATRNRVLLGVALVIAFGIGIALGQALHDNPRPGGEQTSFRTFPPLTETLKP